MATPRKMISPGTGESRPFIAPEGTFPENPILDCHLAGLKIRDMNLTPEQLTQIVYEHTDEGREQRVEGKLTSPHRISVSDPIDSVAGKLKDGYSAGMEAWEVPDARRELMDQHLAQGFRGRWLSDATCKERGLRGFDVVRETSGDQVKLGNMFLGQMPESKAQARTRHFAELNRDSQKRAQERNLEEQARLRAESNGAIRPLAGGSYDGLQDDSFGAERVPRREAGAKEFLLDEA